MTPVTDGVLYSDGWHVTHHPAEAAPTAAAIRSGVERGDPFAVLNQVETGECERGPDFSPSPARAVEPVAVDAGNLAAGRDAVDALPGGNDLDGMEHERQRRLAIWQRL